MYMWPSLMALLITFSYWSSFQYVKDRISAAPIAKRYGKLPFLIQPFSQLNNGNVTTKLFYFPVKQIPEKDITKSCNVLRQIANQRFCPLIQTVKPMRWYTMSGNGKLYRPSWRCSQFLSFEF